MHARVCVCAQLLKVPEFLSPALEPRAWLSSLSAFLCALLCFFSSCWTERRGGQSGGGTEDRSCCSEPAPSASSVSVNFYALLWSWSLWQILLQCSAKRESKAHSVTHTHTLFFLLTPLPLPQSRGKVTPSLRHPASVFLLRS